MTDEQILKQAIEKAVKNGWVDVGGLTDPNLILANHYNIPADIFYRHDFAKHFWSDKEERCDFCKKKEMSCEFHLGVSFIKNWQYHLQQLVLKEEPIKYLEKFL